MDVLKRELQRKRQQLEADFGGRKVLRRAEIEAREIQRLRVAERERLLQKRQKEEQLRSHPAAASSPASSSSSMPTLPPAAVADVAKANDRAEGSRESSLPREEVIRRLRLLRQPATLFGEDDAARLRRLHDALEDPAAVADVDAAEIGEGQTNDFLRDIQALRARAAAKPKAGVAERSHGANEEKEEEVPFDELCDEDKIVAFFKRLLSEWSQELNEMPEAERRTAKGKAAVATCKQCARYLEPLFKLCKKRAVPGDVRRALPRAALQALQEEGPPRRRPARAAGRGEVLHAAGLPGGDGQLHQAGDRQLAVADRGDDGGHPRAVGPGEDPHQQRGPRDERRDDEEVPAVGEAAHDLVLAEVPDGPVEVGRVQQPGQRQRPAVPPRREGRQEPPGGDAPAGGCLLTTNHHRQSLHFRSSTFSAI